MPGLGLVASKQVSVSPQRLIRPALKSARLGPFFSTLERQINASQPIRLSQRSFHTRSTLIRATLSPRIRPGPFTRNVSRYTMQSSRRALSFGPSKVIRFMRFPMTAAGSAIVGGAAYVNYKVQEVSSYTSDKLSQATEFATDLFDGAKGVVEGIEVPDFAEWFDSLKSKAQTNSKSDESADEVKRPNSNQNDDGGHDPKSTVAAAAAAFGGALGLAGDFDDDGKDDQIMLLTRKMIEIRGILQQVDQSDTIQLPSIVVIGSQSSGKSSVLEAIVGHEFLPKGANMVTRRPIELTLINTPNIAAEYGEFPALGLGKITDFTQIQKTLTDLNLAVPEAEAISDEPIQLRIYSPTVPDLTLIDLPGFIQVAASDQPETLKQKINLLCEKYIQSPNIILAISSADVDMANSSALKASRRIDPRGERTIGVITKMDLVDSNKGYQILHDNNYPLQMGYVGVITKAPSASLFRRTSNITSLVSQTEQAFFSQHPEFEDCTVGTYSLRRKLMTVLEKTMAASLQPTSIAIRQELEEASYQFKVEYNDRILTPETYLAGSVDAFKLAFKQLNTQFGRNEVRNLLKAELDQKVLDLLAQRYWNKPIDYKDAYDVHINEHPLSELPKANPNDLYWLRKLDASTSSLTKLGIGRLSTNLVIEALTSEMKHLVDSTNFRNHPFARETIDDAVSGILNLRFYSTSDQVENCIKPYKYEVDVEDREWIKSREHSYNLLKEELRQCEDAFYKIKKTIGGHKLNQVFKFIESTRKNGPIALHEGSDMFGFSQPLIAKGREALFLRDRADIIKMRLAAIKSRQCKSKENKYYCPEIFLDVVATKLTQTAVLFLNVELLSDFYYNFPRELDNRLGTQLTHQQIEAFAKEDPKIKRHVELQQRKELLQMALNKIEGVIELEKSRVREGSLSLNGNHHNDHRPSFRRNRGL